jgi:hypothetical protein
VPAAINKLSKNIMNKSIAVGVFGLAVLGSAVFASGVFASQGRALGQFGPNYSPERHAQMTEVFANNDYTAWKNLMRNRGASRVVTEQNFARFAEMRKLMLEGKTDEANKIRQELGLGNSQGRGIMGGQRGQNIRDNFIDKNGDGICDRMQ